MDRGDLLDANGRSSPPGQGAQRSAADDVKITRHRQPGQHQRAHRDEQRARHPRRALHALTRLDHNRANTQLAEKLGVPSPRSEPRRSGATTGHSCTPTCSTPWSVAARRRAGGRPGVAGQHFIPTVATRGGAIIEARGASSAASAAIATIDHCPTWLQRHVRGRLGVDVGAVRRLVRRARGHRLVVPVHRRRRSPGRSSRDSTSTTSPRAHRRLGRPRRVRARPRQGARPHLSRAGTNVRPSPLTGHECAAPPAHSCPVAAISGTSVPRSASRRSGGERSEVGLVRDRSARKISSPPSTSRIAASRTL